MNKIVGLILAGGNSERMGRDKSKLDFGGKSLLQRIINEHRKIVDQVYVIGKNEYEVENAVGIPDSVENIGPIGGLFTGMNHIKADWYLISPCDMPFLKYIDLQKIIDTSEENNCDAVVANSDNGIESLVAIYNKSILSLMEENINKGKLAIRGLFEQIQIKYLHFNGKIFEKDPFFNINYPEDYEKALSL